MSKTDKTRKKAAHESSLTASLTAKIVQSFGRIEIERRTQHLLSLRETQQQVMAVLNYYICQHCARNGTLVEGCSVFAQYRHLAMLYTRRFFCITLPAGTPASTTTLINGMPLAQAHFVWWFVTHNLDAAFVREFDHIENAMLLHKRNTAKKYRQRQRAKKRKYKFTPQLQLGKTATQNARASSVIVQSRSS